MMVHQDREIHDREMICAILDMCDTLNLGLFDEEYPYVVPLNFGYEYGEDALTFYIHCAKEGYKLHLMQNNPKVCVTISKFVDHMDTVHRNETHDYRSVMAFGELSFIDWDKNRAEWGKALTNLLVKNGRKGGKMPASELKRLYMCKITCKLDHVFGKSQYPLRSMDEVPMPEVGETPREG